MKFLEEIIATAGQIVKDLEHHLEKYPQTADEVITSYSEGKSFPITDVSSVDDVSQDCHGNHCEYVCFEYDWEKEDQGITTSKMLEIFKSLDPNTYVLYNWGEGELGETDSGLRNLYKETDDDAEHDGTFICCYVEDDFVDIFCRPEYEEVECLSGYYPKK